ncbi:hypothetical protein E0K83_16590 [Gramella sp. BOM4]|nr:hypothetical protein [Christiangramia bathymodioli]
MKKLFLLLSILSVSCGKPETASEVIERSIAFHDPENNWNKFQDSLTIRMSMPDSKERISKIYLDRTGKQFVLNMIEENISKTYFLHGDTCWLKLNGSSDFSEAEADDLGLTCERAELFKNYYEYLYGLPMKLQDEAAIIGELEKTEFMGKKYLKVRVTYDEKVGNDIWFFYFDFETYALEAYQFYKKDESGKMDTNSGEYILLDGIKEVSGVKIPKERTWYYNSNEELLGTDFLE